MLDNQRLLDTMENPALLEAEIVATIQKNSITIPLGCIPPNANYAKTVRVFFPDGKIHPPPPDNADETVSPLPPVSAAGSGATGSSAHTTTEVAPVTAHALDGPWSVEQLEVMRNQALEASRAMPKQSDGNPSEGTIPASPCAAPPQRTEDEKRAMLMALLEKSSGAQSSGDAGPDTSSKCARQESRDSSGLQAETVDTVEIQASSAQSTAQQEETPSDGQATAPTRWITAGMVPPPSPKMASTPPLHRGAGQKFWFELKFLD